MTRGAKARLFLGIVVPAVLAASALSQEAVAQSGPLAALRQPAPAGFFGWLLSKQGLFWAGIASTFVMGIGTAISVAAIRAPSEPSRRRSGSPRRAPATAR